MGNPLVSAPHGPHRHTHICSRGLIRYLFELFDYIMTWIRGGQGKKEGEKRRKHCSVMDKG